MILTAAIVSTGENEIILYGSEGEKYRISLATCGEIYYTDIEIHPGLTMFFGNGGDEIGNG